MSTHDIEQLLSRPSSKAGKLQRQCLALLFEHQDAGALPTSVRFLFYELEMRGLLPKAYRHADGSKRARQPGQDVAEALTVLRESGIVAWSAIVDEIRQVQSVRVAGSVADYLRDTIDEARVNPWTDYDPAPVVLTESRSLAGVLAAHLYEYAVPFAALGGQSSGSLLATQVAPLFDEHDKRFVLYLGDHDLSGGHIERSARERLERFVGHEINWQRIAVTAEQIERHGLTPVDKKDHRFRTPRTYQAVETEALSQQVVVSLVRRVLDALLPEPLEAVQVREEQQRAAARGRWREGP